MPEKTAYCSTMRAYQAIRHSEQLVCTEVPKPIPGPHEVLVKLSYTGVCHTDVHVVKGDFGEAKLPLTPGHEGIGIVEALGPSVTSIQVGQRVGIPWSAGSCLKCSLCKTGHENLCEAQKQTGFKRDGSFAEYVVSREEFVGRIPSNLADAEAAPVLCAGLTAYKALKMASVIAGDRIVIAGACGGLGHMAIQYAKLMNLEVVALDVIDESKLELLEELGATFVVDISDASRSLVQQIADLPGGDKRISASVIFAPQHSAFSAAVQYTSPGGTIVAVALPKGDFKLDLITFVLKELRLQGSIVGNTKDLQEALNLVSEGQIRAKVEIKPMEEVNNVLKDLESGKIKGRVVLKISKY